MERRNIAAVTLKDVAEVAGVTVSTASRALSTDKSALVTADTRARVVEAARELNYRGNAHASALRRGSTGTIGVIVADIGNPFIGPVLRGMSAALGGRDLLPITVETRDSSDELLRVCEKLLAQRVDGLIVTAARRGDQSLLRRVAAEVPTVLAVRELSGRGIPAVSHDDVAGGVLAAEHLLSLGHLRSAQLIGPADISSFAGRELGFRESMERAGATCVDIDAAIRLPTVEAGRDLASAMMEELPDPPTAVFAHNDSIAIGAMAELHDRGIRCPEDVSIVGYNDGILTDHLRTPLTTIRLPSFDLGRLAADLLISRLDGSETSASRVVLAPDLVVRQSTSAPRELET